MRWDIMGWWDGMRWDGMDMMRWGRMEYSGMGYDGMDEMRWDMIAWHVMDEMGWWDRTEWILGAPISHPCRCQDGYYGDPVLGSGQQCRPCPCPGYPGTRHYHGSACHADEETHHIVCLCAPGYAGEGQGGHCAAETSRRQVCGTPGTHNPTPHRAPL